MRFLILASLCLVGQPLGAEEVAIEDAPVQVEITLACTFTTECFDLDGCEPTEFNAALEGRAGGLEEASLLVSADLITDAETFTLIGTMSGETVQLAGESDFGRGLLTINDGTARLSVHYADGPMSLTYGGVCQ